MQLLRKSASVRTSIIRQKLNTEHATYDSNIRLLKNTMLEAASDSSAFELRDSEAHQRRWRHNLSELNTAAACVSATVTTVSHLHVSYTYEIKDHKLRVRNEIVNEQLLIFG